MSLTTQAAWPVVDIRGKLFRIGSVGMNQITIVRRTRTRTPGEQEND
jgi:hypothetical protein